MTSQSPQHGPWYRVDSAGTVFTATARKQATTVFRLSATLTRPVHVDRLQQAMEDILPRFPYFAVELRPGVFWSYFQPNKQPPRVLADSRYPCLNFPARGKGLYPFRVLAFHCRLAVEFTHAATDGSGALAFLKSLLAQYLHLREGVDLSDCSDLMLPGQTPDPEEGLDGFRQHYRRRLPRSGVLPRAFQIPYALDTDKVYHLTTGLIQVPALMDVAKQAGVSLTEFLAAICLDTLQEIFAQWPKARRQRHQRPICLDVPVNLRQAFPSKTMLNFFTTVSPALDPRLGHYNFDEILQKVHHTLRVNLNDKELSRAIARNVSARRHPLLRIIPFAVKDHVLPRIYRHWGIKKATCSLSNLGRVGLPGGLTPYVERFDFIPAYPNTRKVGCACISFRDQLSLTFGRTIAEPVLEQGFFRRLTQRGIKVRIETN